MKAVPRIKITGLVIEWVIRCSDSRISHTNTRPSRTQKGLISGGMSARRALARLFEPKDEPFQKPSIYTMASRSSSPADTCGAYPLKGVYFRKEPPTDKRGRAGLLCLTFPLCLYLPFVKCPRGSHTRAAHRRQYQMQKMRDLH